MSVARPLKAVLARTVEVLGHLPSGPQVITSALVEKYANATPPRPRPDSLATDYTSWLGLSDRAFSGRHLPAAVPGPIDLPSEADIRELFRRQPGRRTDSTDTSVLFMFFAQWFTDSFLRVDRDDWRKNTSTQEIDFCQIYGLSEMQTRMLREMQGGRLKSQQIRGEEYPAFLFERTRDGTRTVKPEFKGLHDEKFLMGFLLADVSERQKDLFFAVGLEHGNSTVGSTTLDVLFLREHNRIAGILAREYARGREHPTWKRSMSPADLDERLFQTTRNIMIVLLLKLVVEEYIRHITPYDLPLELVPGMADGKKWNRSNRTAIEFNLLYRWHSLIPDAVVTEEGELDAKEFLRDNNELVLSKGIEWVISRCSRSRAGKVCLFNTPAFLVDRRSDDHPSIEERSISLMRKARLQSYNAYRRQFGLTAMSDFSELTKDIALQQRLRELYGDIDNLEWYVGIFAEDYPDERFLGELLTMMVGHDAFTQALTNPLLASRVYTDATFSKAGMRIIRETKSLQQIVERNVMSPSDVLASFRCVP
jgi:prostaglandin-endoperoxide synthase 2